MTTPNPTRERLFHAAGELRDPAQRVAFLDAACGHDPRLRAEIEELLRHDDIAGSFLNAPAPALVATIDEPPIDRKSVV